MMQVLFSPQRNNRTIEYQFDGEVVNVSIDGVTDIFDFTSMPDGEAVDIETSLPINPIVSAKRIGGVLYLELLNFIGEDATEEERFPEWQEVS